MALERVSNLKGFLAALSLKYTSASIAVYKGQKEKLNAQNWYSKSF
jgi:hypothetical protein